MNYSEALSSSLHEIRRAIEAHEGLMPEVTLALSNAREYQGGLFLMEEADEDDCFVIAYSHHDMLVGYTDDDGELVLSILLRDDVPHGVGDVIEINWVTGMAQFLNYQAIPVKGSAWYNMRWELWYTGDKTPRLLPGKFKTLNECLVTALTRKES